MRRNISAVILVVLTARCIAQARPTTQPEFLQQFDKGYRTLAVIPDPLPNLQRVLTNAPLQKLWSQGKLAQVLAKGRGGRMLPPLQGFSEILEANKRWFPGEIVIGVHESAMADLDHMFRAVLLMNVCKTATTMGDEQGSLQLQKQLLEEMKSLHVPALRLWINFRDEADAREVFKLVTQELKNFQRDGTLPISLVSNAHAVQVSISVADVIPDRKVQLAMLENMGWLSSTDDADADAMAEAFSRLRADASLDLRGTGLSLTLGRPPHGEPLSAADLGPMFSVDDSTIVFGRWDITRLIEAARGWVRLLDELAKTKIGSAFLASDTDDFSGDMRMMARQFEAVGALGSMRAWSGPSSIEFEMQNQGVPAAPALEQSPVMQLIPADASAVMVDTATTLSQRLSDRISDMEGRMETQKLGAQMTGDAKKEQRFEQVGKMYYEHFGPLRKFIHEESRDWFAPGTAFVIGGRGTVRRIEAWPVQEPRVRISFKDLPVVEFAAVGKIAGKHDDGEFARRLYDELVAGVLRAANAPPLDAGTSNIVEVDLGLGVKTWSFDVAWIGNLMTKYAIAIEGDSRPHFFVYDGVLVLSTSPRLSQRMLEAARSKKSLTATGDANAGTLVGYGMIPGKQMQDLIGDMAVWLQAMMDPEYVMPDEVRPPRSEPPDVLFVFQGMGEYLGLIDVMKWRAHQTGDRRNVRGQIAFTH